ncbi:MAG: ABC transporter substrate-binding protein [Janthinobacterium lividum]
MRKKYFFSDKRGEISLVPLALMVVGIFSTSLFAVRGASAQTQEPVTIGIVLPKQGFLGAGGTESAEGAMLEVDARQSTVLGRPIKLIWYDEPNPQGAQQNMARVIDQDKAVAVVGGVASGPSFAMSSIAERAKIPFMVVTAAAQELTGARCNRYTFRTGITVDVAVAAIMPALLKKGKNWYFLSADYAFGQQIYKTGSALLKQDGGNLLGNEYVPVGTTDFSSQILKIRQTSPDVIVAGQGGDDVTNFLKQYKQYGGKSTVGAPIVTDSTILAAGDQPNSLFGKPWHYTDPNNSAEEKAFVKTWRAKYKAPPSVSSWQGWMAMRMLLAAMSQAKSTSGPAIVAALENLRLDGGNLPNYYRSWDHQFIHQVDIVRTKPAGEDKWDVVDVVDRVPAKLSDVDALFGTPEKIGCKMGGA